MDTEKFIKRQKAREKKKKTIESYNSRHVWVVEFVYYVDGKKYWKPTNDNLGDIMCFEKRQEAKEAMDLSYDGHPRDLRVRKYVRVDK